MNLARELIFFSIPHKTRWNTTWLILYKRCECFLFNYFFYKCSIRFSLKHVIKDILMTAAFSFLLFTCFRYTPPEETVAPISSPRILDPLSVSFTEFFFLVLSLAKSLVTIHHFLVAVQLVFPRSHNSNFFCGQIMLCVALSYASLYWFLAFLYTL